MEWNLHSYHSLLHLRRATDIKPYNWWFWKNTATIIPQSFSWPDLGPNPPDPPSYVMYSSSSLGSDLMWSGWSRGKCGAVVLVHTYHSLMLDNWGKAGLTERWLLRGVLPLCCFWASWLFRPDRERSRGIVIGDELRSSSLWSTSLAELISNPWLDKWGKLAILLAGDGEWRFILRSRGSIRAWWGCWSWWAMASYASWGSEVGDDLTWTFMCLRRELGWV